LPLSFTWPLPQILITSKYRLLITQQDLYSIDADWNLEHLLTWIQSYTDEHWHIADYGTFAVLVNKIKMIYFDVASGMWVRRLEPESHYPMLGTICNFHGQLVGGNVLSDWYGCGENSVVWSEIGSFNFTPGKGNVAGFKFLPAEGEVLVVKQLGKGVVIYGSNYIYYMFPAEQTFGFQAIANYGICGRSAVAGDEHKHCFIDYSGKLRVITAELEIQDLQCRRYFYPLLDEVITVSYDPTESRFFICGETTGYVLTSDGFLAEHYQRITSIGQTDEGVVGVAKESDDKSAYFVTEILDFHSRGKKTIQALDFGLEADQECKTGVWWKNSFKDAFSPSPLTTVNNEGVAHLPVSGSDLKIAFHASDYEDISINSLRIRFKITDKRYIRSEYASSVTAGSNR